MRINPKEHMSDTFLTINVNGQEMRLSPEEARSLRDFLCRLLGSDGFTGPYPAVPYYAPLDKSTGIDPDKFVPRVTCSTSGKGAK